MLLDAWTFKIKIFYLPWRAAEYRQAYLSTLFIFGLFIEKAF